MKKYVSTADVRFVVVPEGMTIPSLNAANEIEGTRAAAAVARLMPRFLTLSFIWGGKK